MTKIKNTMGNCLENPIITEDEIKTIPVFTFNGKLIEAYVCDVYDGDTFTCIFTHDGCKQKFKIRMNGYDAPEMKPLKSIPTKKRESIIEKALYAKNFLSDKILKKWIYLECKEFDKYGRILADVKLNKNDSHSINELMITSDFGYCYNGGTKKINE